MACCDDGRGVVFVCGAGGLIGLGGSCVLLFRFDPSFSVFSMIILAMRSNSAHTPSIRCTPPVSASWPRVDRKVTTMPISLVSDLARGSKGFCKILPKSVISADTGKYKASLSVLASVYQKMRVTRNLPNTLIITLRDVLQHGDGRSCCGGAQSG